MITEIWPARLQESVKSYSEVRHSSIHLSAKVPMYRKPWIPRPHIEYVGLTRPDRRLQNQQADIYCASLPRCLSFVGYTHSHFDFSNSQLFNLQCSTSSSPLRQGFSTLEIYCKDLPTGSSRSEALTLSPPILSPPFPLLHPSRFWKLLLLFSSFR